MSHFAVMVIGTTDLDNALQPFHEYECTGIKDKYVVWVDETKKVQDEWDALPLKEKADYAGMAAFAEDYFGYEEREVDGVKQFGHETNPNRQWDWWVLGGRWTGFLKLKEGVRGKVGRPGLMTEHAEAGRADQARKSDIDVAGMRDAAGDKAGAKWDIVNPVIAPHAASFVSWEAMQLLHTKEDGSVDWDAVRPAYHAQPLRQAINEITVNKDHPHREIFMWLDDVESFLGTREAYIEQKRNGALATFAILKDGQWGERGSMGWWGMVSNEEDHAEWDRKFNEMFDALPDDTMISIVDCHI